MDITSIPIARDFTYLAMAMDWFTRRIPFWRESIMQDVDANRQRIAKQQQVNGRLGKIELDIFCAKQM